MSTSPRTGHTVAANVGRKPSGPMSAMWWVAPLRGVTHPTKRLISGQLRLPDAEAVLMETEV